MNRWIERWHGSGPDRGWSIWEMTTSTHGDRVAYVGEGEHSERLTTMIVQKHNESLAAAPEAHPSVPAPWREVVKVMREATEEDAYEMGAKGAPATEQERKLFEAWMRGHCWALCAHWNGSGYVSDAEQGGNLDPRAMVTRQLWAAWRDRAALAQLDALEGGE